MIWPTKSGITGPRLDAGREEASFENWSVVGEGIIWKPVDHNCFSFRNIQLAVNLAALMNAT
jgi:hypothetical protein